MVDDCIDIDLDTQMLVGVIIEAFLILDKKIKLFISIFIDAY